MAENDTTSGLRVLTGDALDEISKLLDQATGVVDLMGNVVDKGLDHSSINSASWAVKDMLRAAQVMIDGASAMPALGGVKGGAV